MVLLAGETVAGDLQLALREGNSSYDFGSLDKYDYLHDRSPFKEVFRPITTALWRRETESRRLYYMIHRPLVEAFRYTNLGYEYGIVLNRGYLFAPV